MNLHPAFVAIFLMTLSVGTAIAQPSSVPSSSFSGGTVPMPSVAEVAKDFFQPFLELSKTPIKKKLDWLDSRSRMKTAKDQILKVPEFAETVNRIQKGERPNTPKGLFAHTFATPLKQIAAHVASMRVTITDGLPSVDQLADESGGTARLANMTEALDSIRRRQEVAERDLVTLANVIAYVKIFNRILERYKESLLDFIASPIASAAESLASGMVMKGLADHVAGWEYLDADALGIDLGAYRAVLESQQRALNVARQNLQTMHAKLSASRDISIRKVELDKAMATLKRRKQDAEVDMAEKGAAVEASRRELAATQGAIRQQLELQSRYQAEASRPYNLVHLGYEYHINRQNCVPALSSYIGNRNAAIDNAGRATDAARELQGRADAIAQDMAADQRVHMAAVARRNQAAGQLAELPRQFAEYCATRRAEVSRLLTAVEEQSRELLENARLKEVREQLTERSMEHRTLGLMLRAMVAEGEVKRTAAPPPTEMDRRPAPPPTERSRPLAPPPTERSRPLAPPPTESYNKAKP